MSDAVLARHKFSTFLTNSCIKQPLDMHSNTVNGFSSAPDAKRSIDAWTETELQPTTFPSSTYQEQTSHPFQMDNTDRLSNLSNDDFYQRLLQMKAEHKQTLNLYEKLYNEQKSHVNGHSSLDGFFEPQRSRSPPLINRHVYDHKEIETTSRPSTGHAVITRDNVKDMSSKPPRSPGVRASRTSGIKSSLRSSRFRPSWTQSLDEDEWKVANSLSTDESEDEGEEILKISGKRYEPEDRTHAISQISGMWNDFSINDYAPKKEPRRHSATVNDKKEEKTKEWKCRITVPQPFNMMLREEDSQKKKTSAQKDLDLQRMEKLKAEEEECQKKFKATPAPAHIYLPLFNEIMEKNESRARMIKEYSAELLQMQQKPFNFMKREEDKKKWAHDNYARVERKSKKDLDFKAKPVPDYLYDQTINDKILEEEEYRKIRMKMRSAELLRSASMPPNMEAMKHYKEQKMKEKVAKRKPAKRAHNPKINRYVPDYDYLHKKFQNHMMQRKQGKEATITQPFNLRSSMNPSSRQRVLEDMERDEETLIENRWPYRSTRRVRKSSLGVLSSSIDSLPSKTTTAAVLRSSVNKNRMKSLTQEEAKEIENDRNRRQKEMHLRKQILEKASLGDDIIRQREAREKLRRHKEDEHLRMQAYQEELDSMMEKVNSRPLLFERESQTNARKAAEKKYQSTLKSHGLDEKFVTSQSSAAGSTREDDYSDEFDDTYVKYGGGNASERTLEDVDDY